MKQLTLNNCRLLAGSVSQPDTKFSEAGLYWIKIASDSMDEILPKLKEAFADHVTKKLSTFGPCKVNPIYKDEDGTITLVLKSESKPVLLDANREKAKLNENEEFSVAFSLHPYAGQSTGVGIQLKLAAIKTGGKKAKVTL